MDDNHRRSAQTICNGGTFALLLGTHQCAQDTKDRERIPLQLVNRTPVHHPRFCIILCEPDSEKGSFFLPIELWRQPESHEFLATTYTNINIRKAILFNQFPEV